MAIIITKKEYLLARNQAAEMIKTSGIIVTDREIQEMEIVDFGLSNLFVEGAQIVSFFNTNRVSVKVIALFPNQTEPEHWHNSFGNNPGKEETLRIVKGTVRLYIPGEHTMCQSSIPSGKEQYYTVRHEILLGKGDQITIEPGTKHWFQSGDEGAVMFTFSSSARDTLDAFTDPEIVRITKVGD